VIASVEQLRVRCPAWCIAAHDRDAPGGWLPPNGDAVIHTSVPFLEMVEAGNLADILRVIATQRQTHPDGGGDQATTEILVEGVVTVSRRADVRRLIAALSAAESLLSS
jgi:hypothetical protein